MNIWEKAAHLCAELRQKQLKSAVKSTQSLTRGKSGTFCAEYIPNMIWLVYHTLSSERGERREDMRRNTKRDINGIKVKPDKDKYVLMNYHRL
jgi:hypothetical protein